MTLLTGVVVFLFFFFSPKAFTSVNTSLCKKHISKLNDAAGGRQPGPSPLPVWLLVFFFFFLASV